MNVLKTHVIGTDATVLKVLDPTSAEHVVKALWCDLGDGTDVVYTFPPTGATQYGSCV